ncbi:pre-rRNA-processing protein TSR1 [Enteropsectra breve]|nr:pre-rRNA-processing protein TSR1 [Enteropsectra breve]
MVAVSLNYCKNFTQMRNHVKKNRTKQKLQKRAERINKETSVYTKTEAYRVFTTIALSQRTLELELQLPYNYVMYNSAGMTATELSYIARCSDLLILTVTDANIESSLVSLICRFMPTVVIVYERKHKNIARTVSKLFGDARICDVTMLNQYLANFEMQNTMLCRNRPFMVAQEASYENGQLILTGFMKAGLRSNKVIINGAHEGIVSEVAFGDTVISGEELNVPVDERQLIVKDNEVSEEDETEQPLEYEEEESMADEESFVNEEEEIDPEYDLIENYKEYRGIKNLAKCTFKGQAEPEYYKDLIFMKNMSYVQNTLANIKSPVPKNSYVTLKINVNGPITDKFFVLFSLFEYEANTTIMNYEFSAAKPLNKEVVVDNGYRIFKTRNITSRNLNNNVFEEEPSLERGIISFTAPFSFYSTVAYVLEEDCAVKLQNGYSKDRLFFEKVELKGKPIKICKKHIVVKGMFFSKEQVEHFGNIRLEAKGCNSGYIIRSLGTKGHFKAYFASPVKHGDIIVMPLYKRIFL